jgi:ribonuclease P protein component
MISKSFRLTEQQIRKVLSNKKPFFSYIFIANTRPNTRKHWRIGILLSWKQARWSVNRNTIRRKIYDLSKIYLDHINHDIVLVPKKGMIFDSKNEKSIEEMEKNIIFLLKKIIETLPKSQTH